MTTSRMTTWVVSAAALLGACGALSAADQPPPPPPAERPAGDEPSRARPPVSQPAEQERSRIRERIQRMRERLAGEQRRLEEAERLLDQGKPLEELRPLLPRPGQGPGSMGPRDGMGPGQPPPPPDDRPPAIEGVRLDRLLDYIGERNPELAKRLRQFRERDPEAFRAMMEQRARAWRDIVDRRFSDPEANELAVKMLDLELRAGDSARLAAEAQGPERDRSVGELKDLVAQQFDVRLRISELEAKQLSEGVKRLEENIAKRRAEREQAISRRVDEMLSNRGRPERRPPPPDGPGAGPDDRPGGGPRPGGRRPPSPDRP
ncbi:MAG: hypothetical protein IBJ11_02445 [Phycisphaerales bacterium]|nr:hypothetical protein [Phycisphaerales bacterium]